LTKYLVLSVFYYTIMIYYFSYFYFNVRFLNLGGVFCVFFFFVFWKTKNHYVSHTGSNFWFFCLSLPSAGITEYTTILSLDICFNIGFTISFLFLKSSWSLRKTWSPQFGKCQIINLPWKRAVWLHFLYLFCLINPIFAFVSWLSLSTNSLTCVDTTCVWNN
jgi:hypothetical protein